MRTNDRLNVFEIIVIIEVQQVPNVKVNRKYKDRLFRLRFGMEEYKKDMLLLYNALNETAYENEKDLSITTILSIWN